MKTRSLWKFGAVATLSASLLSLNAPAFAEEAPSAPKPTDVYVSDAEREAGQMASAAAVGSPNPGFNCEATPWDSHSNKRVWNGAAGLYQDGNTVMNASNILVVGDSQVWNQSWATRGIQQAGYNPIEYRCGGVGFVSWRPNYSGSYYGGIVKNEWDLPLGKPRAIYIQGSGNDSYNETDRVEAVQRAKESIDKLRVLYPGVQIILTGPLGSDVSWQAHRKNFNEKLSAVAREKNVTFMSYQNWVTDYGYRWALQDDVHFQDRYQGLLAAPARNSFNAALAGFTLKGGVQSYVSNTGGSAYFGVPTSNETASVDGGVWQSFSNAKTVYWSPFGGTHSVKLGGEAIGNSFRAAGYERGVGYPIEDETAYYYGVRQVFQKANGEQTRFYWSANTGSHAMNGNGAIFNKWVQAGHAPTLGFPATDEISREGGALQYFRASNGRETGIYWSPATGAHTMNSKGAIYNHFARTGYIGKYGFPTTDEYTDANGVTHVKFSGGADITWTARGGVVVR
ncbi:GDSL-type esterase/lipase family protein [Rothia terrae]|uniref:GDSL-type esterase/lipase family protein n=1 Tax=Rothia terrae TaxID=396015 RepID=UPI002882C63F|nr:GDSL-type esterase/lipase family protein [Rothia terrae]MDT0189640.1 GDSL-type esterase/lipase family protein [Rothia terrae]